MKSKLLLGLGLFAFVCAALSVSSSRRDSEFQTAPRENFDARVLQVTNLPGKKSAGVPSPTLSTSNSVTRISAANRRFASADRNPLDFKNRVLEARKKRTELLGAPDTTQLAAGSLRQGESYGFLPGVWAIPEKKISPNDERRVVERSVGYAFIRANRDEPIPEGALPVAMNEASQSVGVATGVVSVKFVNPISATAVASEFGLKLVQGYEPLQVALYQSSRIDPNELTTLLTALRKDERVERANLEILDRVRVPK